MAASIYERALRIGDWENDGGIVDLDQFKECLILYEAGIMSAARVKELIAVSVSQESDIQDILDTMPGTILSLVQATARARWAMTIICVLTGGLRGYPEFDTEAECKTALGI